MLHYNWQLFCHSLFWDKMADKTAINAMHKKTG